jgi:hypothetical protein
MDEDESRSYPIREDMAFQRRSWVAERIGWAAMGLVLLAALTGVFALGPLARTSASTSDGGLVVDHARFVHKTARTWFTIRVAPPAREILVRLSPQFPASFDIESMEPRPLRSSAGAQGIELVFAPSRDGGLAVHIGARPKRFGFASISIEAEGRGKVELTQLIYP